MVQEIQTPAQCPDQLIVTPSITCVEGKPNLRKMQGVSIVTGQLATIRYTMRDINGDPVDLSLCMAAGSVVKLRVREAIEMCDWQQATISGSVVDLSTNGADGVVQATLTEPVTHLPGIYRCEFAILSNDTPQANLIFSNEFFLIVNRGQFANIPFNHVRTQGPPTLPEIRLHLRDSDPADNLWLGVQEFDTAEIAACIERPIHYFNEAPPPINQRFNTSNFPSRYFYLEAIVGCLYQMAAIHYMRTHLPYQQQQGLSIDDKNKAEQYAAEGKQRWEEWKNWVRHKKVQINAAAAFQSMGSPYWGTIWNNNVGGLR